MQSPFFSDKRSFSANELWSDYIGVRHVYISKHISHSSLCHFCVDLNCSISKDFLDLLTLFGVICRATNVNKIAYPSKGSEYWFYFKFTPTRDSIKMKSKKHYHLDDTRIFYKM